jgi:signal transduction histidine kinase
VTPSEVRDGRKPSAAFSVFLLVATTALMGWLRLYVYHDRVLSLGSALPLALCLWHRDRRLLWAMAAAQSVLSLVKVGQLSAGELGAGSLIQGGMQLLNIAVVGAAVHSALRLTDRLKARNADLGRINAELAAREEEIRAQNEEIQAQSEELQKQNEELQQQSEEAARQSEELQAVGAEVGHRERLLQALLDALPTGGQDRSYLENVCRAMLDLFGGRAVAAAVLEPEGDDLVVRAYVGPGRPARDRWSFAGSFAAIVLHHGRTAFVEDLRNRPDLQMGHEAGMEPRSVLATPLRGTVRGIVKVYADVPRTWTEEEFRILEWVSSQFSLVLEAQRLRAGLEKAVADRTAELRDLVEELQHFSYTITHDMRAPLRSMQGFAELLAEQAGPALDADGRGHLERIVASAGRMDRLITDALSYAKALREHMSLEVVDVDTLLRGMIDSYPTFRAPQADIRIDGPLPPVRANVAGLTQCFSNLLGNAVKFARDGRTPEVRVRAETRGGRVRIWCEDEGIGIPAEIRARLFQMFQRGSKAYDGTGIGLALVRKVVEHMGGAVGVESEPGKGSRFWIELQGADGARPS